MTDSRNTHLNSGPEQGDKGGHSNGTDEAITSAAAKGGGIRRFIFTVMFIVFLGAVTVGMLAAIEYYAYLQVKKSNLGNAYKGKDLDLARRSSQQVAPVYGYEPTPGFAATRNTRLGNAVEYINEQSFKDFDPTPMDKPDNEYRVFVTGGSVVYGRGPVPPADRITDFYEVTYRWNIPHIMEKILNADPRMRERLNGKEVRVINAGVPGYVLQNDLLRHMGKIRLFDPDLVVSLDGANEVHTVARPLKDWNYFTEGQYHEVIVDIMDMSQRGMVNYLTLWLKRNTYFFTWMALQHGEGPGVIMESRGFSSHPMAPTQKMLEQRNDNIDQVADVAALYHTTLETDGIPHILSLQPMFRNCKKKLTPMERRISEVAGMIKVGFYDAEETYDLLVKRIIERCNQVGHDPLDLTGCFDNVNEWVFTDWCHVTNGANYIMGKLLANEVKTRILGLDPLPSDELDKDIDSYFKDFSKDAKVLVNHAPSNEGLRILKGYPGEEVFEVEKGSSPASLTLDLGEVKPVSRMRIVWADKESAPDRWALETSIDGHDWSGWIEEQDAQTDRFDKWPGYEKYTPEVESARYVRYIELDGGDKRAVRLRQLSVYR
jgi:hypothetical protein